MELVIEGLHKKQKEIVNDILQSDAKFHTLNSSRQAGKTYLLSKLAMILGLIVKNENILVISPTYEQVRIIFDNVMSNETIKMFTTNVKESKPYEIKLKTGTRIFFKSAERIDSLRGGSNQFVIIDEMSFTKEGLMDTIIRPSTAAKKNSKIIIASTPKGKDNDFFRMFDIATKGDPNYAFYEMSYKDNPHYDLSEVEDAKKRLPRNIFRQEYEAEFIDDGGDVFDGLDKVMILQSFKTYEAGRYFCGIDFGKVNDSTVVTILDKDKEVVFIQEYSGNWSKQQKDIGIVLRKYNPLTYGEVNGVGSPLIDGLKTEYNKIFPFITSNTSKREIIEDLRMVITLEQIKLPSSTLRPKLNIQMNDYTFSITKSGLITYHHSAGKNDDYVDSLAIANYCYDKHNKQFRNPVMNKRSNFYG